jgi:hypothetical protein
MNMESEKTEIQPDSVGYATQPDGSLKEITTAKIPYNSPQGLAGF